MTASAQFTPIALIINNFGADALGIDVDLLQPPSHLIEVTDSIFKEKTEFV